MAMDFTKIQVVSKKLYIIKNAIIMFDIIFVFMYTCNVQSYHSFFLLDNSTAQRFVNTELAVRDCSDVGKPPLDNMAECREASSSLGFTYVSTNLSLSHNPKGCFELDHLGGGYVFWNNHETGSERPNAYVICKASGKYLLFY